MSLCPILSLLKKYLKRERERAYHISDATMHDVTSMDLDVFAFDKLFHLQMILIEQYFKLLVCTIDNLTITLSGHTY